MRDSCNMSRLTTNCVLLSNYPTYEWSEVSLEANEDLEFDLCIQEKVIYYYASIDVKEHLT